MKERLADLLLSAWVLLTFILAGLAFLVLASLSCLLPFVICQP